MPSINWVGNKSTTPRTVSESILELCRRLDPTQQPRYVPVKPWDGGRVDSCFYNILDKIEIDGGGVQYGWTIWENAGLLIEAEFHAAWVSPEKDLIDITKKSDGEQQILFLPDSKRVWESKMIDNVRVPLVDNDYTRKLIRYGEATFKLRQKHWKNGISEIPFEEFQRHQREYGQSPPIFETGAYERSGPKIGRNQPCYCGSDKKYKKCHGK